MNKKCPICGAEFETENSRKIYCSNSCSQKSYYRRNREKMLAYAKQYRQEHRDSILEHQKKYYQDHREKIIERNKQYLKQHKEQNLKYQREYQRLNYRSKIKYPCWRYKAKNSHKITDKLCLNCNAPKCRFYYE